MKCNIEDLVCNIKEQLGDVDLEDLLNGCLGSSNTIEVNSDFVDDDELDMFDNDENGVIVRDRNSRNRCCRTSRPSCCSERKEKEENEERATMGCVQNVCKEVAKRIGNVRVTSKFGCACGEPICGAEVLLQRKDCCGDFKDVATAITGRNGVAEFSCVETGEYRIVQVIDGRFFNPPCYIPCDTFTITPANRCINITVVNTLNPIAERMLRERREARRIMRLIEREQGRRGRRCHRRNNCCCNNGGNNWIWIILIFFVFGCGGFGFGCC